MANITTLPQELVEEILKTTENGTFFCMRLATRELEAGSLRLLLSRCPKERRVRISSPRLEYVLQIVHNDDFAKTIKKIIFDLDGNENQRLMPPELPLFLNAINGRLRAGKELSVAASGMRLSPGYSNQQRRITGYLRSHICEEIYRGVSRLQTVYVDLEDNPTAFQERLTIENVENLQAIMAMGDLCFRFTSHDNVMSQILCSGLESYLILDSSKPRHTQKLRAYLRTHRITRLQITNADVDTESIKNILIDSRDSIEELTLVNVRLSQSVSLNDFMPASWDEIMAYITDRQITLRKCHFSQLFRDQGAGWGQQMPQIAQFSAVDTEQHSVNDALLDLLHETDWEADQVAEEETPWPEPDYTADYQVDDTKKESLDDILGDINWDVFYNLQHDC